MKVPADWQSSAVLVTCGFETTGDPYVMIAGDFDKMGISCGALQWNIGMGSLQPMVKAAGKTVVHAAMPTHGAEMWNACNSTVAQGLTVVRAWQKMNAAGVPILDPVPRLELRALMGTPNMRSEQNARINSKASTALTQATAWAKERDGSAPSKRLFIWMFDIATQNGSLEGQSPKTVADFIAFNKQDKVDDLVCDYLAAFVGKAHAADARRNATLWRGAARGEKLELLCLSYLRAQTANAKWRHVVINRKGSIAMGGGWVNSSKRDFSDHGL
jgi:hypothetical protein